MTQTMSVAGMRVWGLTLGQVLLTWDWWDQSRKLVIHPWYLRGKTIQVVLVRIVAHCLDKRAVRTEDGTGTKSKAHRPKIQNQHSHIRMREPQLKREKAR